MKCLYDRLGGDRGGGTVEMLAGAATVGIAAALAVVALANWVGKAGADEGQFEACQDDVVVFDLPESRDPDRKLVVGAPVVRVGGDQALVLTGENILGRPIHQGYQAHEGQWYRDGQSVDGPANCRPVSVEELYQGDWVRVAAVPAADVDATVRMMSELPTQPAATSGP